MNLLDKLAAWLFGPVLAQLGQISTQQQLLLSNQQSILALLSQTQKEVTMTLDQLQAQVQQTTTVEQSAITLIQGLAAQLAAAATDPAKVQALADQLKASSDALAAAITANTPGTAPVQSEQPL